MTEALPFGSAAPTKPGGNMFIRGADIGVKEDDYYPVVLETDFGRVSCRYYEAAGTGPAAIWVGGIGGDWDTPARGLYPRLCGELAAESMSSLRVRFRNAVDLNGCVSDVRAGLAFLARRHVSGVALIGHSLGGAVVIEVGATSELVRTVVALSTQSYGAESVVHLAPRSILLIHGVNDTVLPASSSRYIYQIASEPKQLVLLQGAGHVLDESADEVYTLVRQWLTERLIRVG